MPEALSGDQLCGQPSAAKPLMPDLSHSPDTLSISMFNF